MNIKKFFSYLSLIVAIILVVIFLIYIGSSPKNTKEINGITFVSDGNVVELLTDMRDWNNILIFDEIGQPAVFSAKNHFVKLYAALHRNFKTMYIYDNNCGIYDRNSDNILFSTKEECEKMFYSHNGPKIVFKEKSFLANGFVVKLDTNYAEIQFSNLEKLPNDTRKFILTVYPEYEEIEKAISKLLKSLPNIKVSSKQK